jgi:WD40 repeat protein
MGLFYGVSCRESKFERFCGSTSDYRICIYDMDANIIERIMIGHTNYIRTIIPLECGRLYSCSVHKTVKLWNIESSQCELTIYGHTDILCS